MSHRREKRARRAARARAAIVTAASLDVLLLASPATAQDADTQEIGEITVTGFRASLADALSKKRNSNLIVEAVTAEDLGKFPDQNIAESLQRLSGVQIDRVVGQGTQVRIRGLSQNISLLDDDFFLTGMELYKLGEGNTRFNDSLEGIPSELVGGVDVYKSSSADLVEGALGGTLNFRTRRAIDMKEGFTIGGNVRVNQGDYLDDVEPSGAVVAAFNREGRFGVTASFSYDKTNVHEDELAGNNRANWRWINSVAGRAGPVPGSVDPGDASECIFDNWSGTGSSCGAAGGPVAPYISPELLYTTHRDQYRERWGGSIGFDWKPSESSTVGLDWFHSNLDFSTEEVGNKVWFDSNNLGRGPDPTQPFEVDANGVVQEATFRALGAEVISFVQAAEAQSDNFQASFAWDNGGALRANFKATYSTADMTSDSANNDVQKAPYGFPNPDGGSPTGWSSQPALNPTAPGGSTPYSFRYVNDGTLPSVEFLGGAADLLSNPAYTMFKSHWAFGDRSQDDAYSGRADFQFDPAFAENNNIMLSGGLRYSDRDIDFTSGRYLVDWSSRGELDGSQVLTTLTGEPQEFGSWFYFQDAAIGNRACDFASSTYTRTIPGLPPGVNDCARFGNSPLIVAPVESVTTTPGRSETIGDFFPSGSVGSDVVAQDRSQMRNPAGWLQSLYPNQTVQFFVDQPESFKINQKITAGYVMADLGAPDDRYHVNFGARVVLTEQDVEQHGPAPGGRLWGSDTWNGVIRDFTTTVTTKSYTDVLPSMNAYIDFTEQQKVRMSMARVMSRPNPYDLGRGFQTFFTRTTIGGVEGFQFSGGSAGNPDLDPFRASQVDLSYEYYFGRQNAVIATVFYKDVDSFIGNRTAPEVVDDDFGGSPGAVTRPFNGEGGRIQGIELGVQYAFDFGFGINANYTYSDSKSPETTSFDASLPIQGVAENSFNGQVYFEAGGFGARLSYAWVDKIYRGSFGLNDGSAVYGRFDRPYGQLDGQVSYQITDKFGVLFGAVNITEEDQSQYLQFSSQPFTFHSGERHLYLGATAAF